MDILHVILGWLGATLLILLLALPLIYACRGIALLEAVPKDSSWRYRHWNWKIAPVHFWLAIAFFSVIRQLSSLCGWRSTEVWSHRASDGVLVVAMLFHFVWAIAVMRGSEEPTDATRRLARIVAWFSGALLLLLLVAAFG